MSSEAGSTNLSSPCCTRARRAGLIRRRQVISPTLAAARCSWRWAWPPWLLPGTPAVAITRRISSSSSTSRISVFHALPQSEASWGWGNRGGRRPDGQGFQDSGVVREWGTERADDSLRNGTNRSIQVLSRSLPFQR